MATATATVPVSPALVPWCRIVESRGRVLVEHGETVVTFEGGAAELLLPALLPLLDGTRPVDEIVETLGRPIAPAVLTALSLLAENGLLADGPQSATDGATMSASFVAEAGLVPSIGRAAEAIRIATVTVVGTGLAASETARQLEDAGIGQVERTDFDDGIVGSFVVAAPSPAEAPELEALNARRLESRDPWLQILPFDGRLVVVGPVFLPRQSACRTCYALRRAATSGYEEDFEVVERTPVRAASPLAISAVAAGLASVLTLRWLSSCDPNIPGTLYTFEHGSILRVGHHRVLRVPRCPSCGLQARALPALWADERP